MASRVQVILEDDIDGGEAAETVAFSFDGSEYEIDLSESNMGKFRDALAPWVGHARKTGGRQTGGRRRKSTARSSGSGGSASTSEIRAWAQANGYEVSARGRVSAEVREAYERAHS